MTSTTSEPHWTVIKNGQWVKVPLTVVVKTAVPPVCVKTVVEVAVSHGSEISVTEK